jgi:hypothetical protein
MKELVFFLEEDSAKALLHSLVPRLIGTDSAVRYVVFEGKQDMERQLERKMQRFLNPKARFIVVRDKDSGDCRQVKRRLQEICTRAGKPDATIRIACHEIESWYLADLHATGKAYGISLAHLQDKKKFRNPDDLGNPVQELRRLVPDYEKIDGSRRIGLLLDLENSRSRSYYNFIQTIIQAADNHG